MITKFDTARYFIGVIGFPLLANVILFWNIAYVDKHVWLMCVWFMLTVVLALLFIELPIKLRWGKEYRERMRLYKAERAVLDNPTNPYR